MGLSGQCSTRGRRLSQSLCWAWGSALCSLGLWCEAIVPGAETEISLCLECCGFVFQGEPNHCFLAPGATRVPLLISVFLSGGSPCDLRGAGAPLPLYLSSFQAAHLPELTHPLPVSSCLPLASPAFFVNMR